jgi:hypothetical protein
MGRVAVDFGVGQDASGPSGTGIADIRSDLDQASNAGQRQNQRNPEARDKRVAGGVARSLQPAAGMRLTRSWPSALLPPRPTHPSISTVS